MARGLLALSRMGGRRWWLVVTSAAFSLVAAPSRRRRGGNAQLQPLRGRKKAGDVHMTINRQDDGTTAVSCDTDVRVGAIITLYKYSYRGRELWKDGRVQHFESKGNDDGKEYAVTATAAADGLHVRVNDGEHTAPADAWLDQLLGGSRTPSWPTRRFRCWTPTAAAIWRPRCSSSAPEKYGPNQEQTVQHLRLTGKKLLMDLWYDDARRLVREEWVEDGHRTVMGLDRVRR